MNMRLNYEGQKCKTGPVRGVSTIGKERVNGEGKGG
jgi:hypothetical protein